ncbi:MAG TPA: GNVR domain-containing protein [Treponemataceae bacterium]|nr:GNVR domain-containing protein [Treponemataceae bacterium]
MSELNTVPPSDCNNDDEISLLDLFAIIWKRKLFIIIFTVICAVGVVLYAYISIKLPPEKSYLPNKYTSTAIMMINSGSSSSGGLASALSASGLGSLAGLMGVSASGGSSNGQLAVYLLTSNSFLDAMAEELDVAELFDLELGEFPKTTLRGFFKENLKANLTSGTGILELTYTHTNKEFATDVVNCAARLLEQRFKSLGLDQNLLKKEHLEKTMQSAMNEVYAIEKKMQELETESFAFSGGSIPRVTMELAKLKRELSMQEAIYSQMRQEYELLKISMSSDTPIFQILEYAEIPERKSEPSRAVICMIGTVAGFFIAVFLCFIFNIIDNIKNDKEAMAKLGFKKKDI